MQNEFEKELSKRMAELHITPQPEIWQRVEAALPPEKRRRRVVFWWWLLPLVGCIGFFTWLAIPSFHNHRKNINNTVKEIANRKIPATEESAERNSVDTMVKEPTVLYADQHTEKATRKTQQTANSKKTTSKNRQVVLVSVESRRNASQKSSQAKRTVAVGSAFSYAKNKLTKGSVADSGAIAKSDLPVADDIMQSIVTPQAYGGVLMTNKDVDTAHHVVAKVDEQTKKEDTTSISKPDTVAAANEAKKPAKQKQSKAKKVEWKGMFAFGINWLHPGGDSASLYRTVYDQAYYSSPVNVGNGSIGSGNNAANTRFTAPQGGLALSAGIVRKQQITTAWNWQLGLQYNLLTSKQWVGKVNDTAAFLRINNIERAYATGSLKNYQQFTHQLQLLPAINYVVQPAAKLPLQLSAGAIVAYTFSTNMLMHNRQKYIYEQSGKDVNRLQLGAQLGASLFISKRFQLGFVYQYAFSKTANKPYLSDFRWRQLQLQASFSLSNHPKK